MSNLLRSNILDSYRLFNGAPKILMRWRDALHPISSVRSTADPAVLRMPPPAPASLALSTSVFTSRTPPSLCLPFAHHRHTPTAPGEGASDTERPSRLHAKLNTLSLGLPDAIGSDIEWWDKIKSEKRYGLGAGAREDENE
ncbi:uncharacterized protein PHACADRAFT_214542 [Phanerochaete carnosa HHB-10118-sp]|uniref:Uncharacterized protein n=1 Tax=Phanerochaete carnosa (strain HHB-10118-sp) TaxID=650164 RepID=K5WFP1_PHACS|nr:uncharacterized protein PHACADRAFT_214542 [Phanerochaete carnosa HHB-10118-sp]EKM49007.1 hypothetical protein PHACADRAFT_214542 [Phanerochaete carnosa HHB-10118-sp]